MLQLNTEKLHENVLSNFRFVLKYKGVNAYMQFILLHNYLYIKAKDYYSVLCLACN